MIAMIWYEVHVDFFLALEKEIRRSESSCSVFVLTLSSHGESRSFSAFSSLTSLCGQDHDVLIGAAQTPIAALPFSSSNAPPLQAAPLSLKLNTQGSIQIAARTVEVSA